MEADLLRIEQATAIAGVGRTTGFDLIRKGEWPAIKIGRSLRIPREGLQSWLAEQSAKAQARAAELREACTV